jgi:hypothetical protein
MRTDRRNRRVRATNGIIVCTASQQNSKTILPVQRDGARDGVHVRLVMCYVLYEFMQSLPMR